MPACFMRGRAVFLVLKVWSVKVKVFTLLLLGFFMAAGS